jgi:16S rRNA processing protein RimM
MIRVGKIVATHGVQGAVIMTHVAGDSRWLKKGDALMVEMQKGSYIPYFVDSCRAANDKEYVVNIEELDKVENAKRLVGKHVFVEEDLLADYAKESPLLWIGFTITDVHTGLLGTMDDVIQTPAQWLGKVMYNDKEVLIPLLNQFIKEVQVKKRRLIMELPAGLLEVYM